MVFKYKVSYYEEVEGKMMEAKGFVSAPNVSEAVKEIASFYGEEFIDSIKIYPTGATLYESESVTKS